MLGNAFAQQTDHVDFKNINAVIWFDEVSIDTMKIVEYEVRFDILKPTDSIFLNAVNMEFYNVLLNDKPISVLNDGKKLIAENEFKKSVNNTLRFDCKVFPKKAIYAIKDQIWTQGQGNQTSNWLPSIDDVNDKIEFDLSVVCKNDYEAIANGWLIKKEIGEKFTKWSYDMQQPIPSYLVALAIGKYEKIKELSKSKTPLEYYYYPDDSLKVEPTYRYTKQMFDFLEGEIGFDYPWQNYKQVPVKDFLYSGMENTGLTIFSDTFVIDSIGFNDRNYLTVNAHELAHQWFGNLVTATSGKHHWLQEGFATYYALLAEQHIFGENHYYWQLFENAQELIAQESAGKSTSLLDPRSSSETFYKKGAWALHILREKVGDSVFKVAVKSYLEKHQYLNVETSDFISEIEKASGKDLTSFVNQWLVQVKLPEDEMVKSLKRSSFMQEYFMVDCEVYNSKCIDYLESYVSDKAKIKVISQMVKKIDSSAFYNSLEVRQAIAKHMRKIPLELKSHYETLLNDKSYVTIENALYYLWVNFPEERAKYLQKTKDCIGFSDYNVKLLWLALHLNTVMFQPDKKQYILDKLISYCLANHHYELRINAFRYIKLLNAFEEKSIRSLIDATKHHNWRFAKFAKNLLSELETIEAYKLIIDNLKNQ